ncbi:MAG: hypothetical protein RLZZ500_693 [Bacteroidota bacterium]|jgi:uncharacterized protein YggE
MKKLFFTLLLFIGSIALQAQNIADKPKISVVGSGSVSVFPNAAAITLQLTHVKPTLREAVNENQQTMKLIRQIVLRYVKDTTEIKTSLITTDKATRWDSKMDKEIFIGFRSNQKIIFTILDLDKIQDLTEELLKTKFQRIERISYFNTNFQEHYKKAEELAVADALETTRRLANHSNVQLGKILTLSSNKSPNDSNVRINTEEFETFGKGMGGRGVSSSGELIKYSVTVNLQTEILN